VSKAWRVPAADRTATMVELVRRSYPQGLNRMSLSHVVLTEIAPGTGWAASNRWADVLALGVWPSRGLTLAGYEIKASRADLKRELADPGKHSALARYCDTWTLVAWDESVLLVDLPKTWGIMTTVQVEDGERALQVKRKPSPLKPEPWPKAFMCSLVRNAYEQSPGADYLARAVAAAALSALRDGREDVRSEMARLLDPIKRLLYGDNRYHWPPEAHSTEAVCEAIVTRLSQGDLALQGEKT
jgi:hypothetical protein